MPVNKFEIKDLDFFYGDFQALHKINTVSYTHMTLPKIAAEFRSRWWPVH